MTPANAFETSVGHFWGILNTRDYMRARFALTVQLREAATLDSIAEMVDHYRDMLRLCRNDNMGIRDILPCLLLQLDRDQECYDFVKWWMVESQVEEDWREDGESYLSTHDADAYEDVTYFDQRFLDLNHAIAILLLKVKLLVDVRSLRLCRKVLEGRNWPNEIIDKVQLSSISSPLSQKLVGLSIQELEALENRLIVQCQKLGGYTCTANFHFWRNFWEANDHLEENGLPQCSSQGSWEEMLLVFYHSHPAWWQTEGVVELLTIADRFAMGMRLKNIDMPAKQQEALMKDNPAFGPNMVGEVAGGRDMWMWMERALKTQDRYLM
ncbi:hypothetical protein LTR64_001879 [Lithohypha guttulata]|uniref:uncharacterized protein n=1 Tax=Lithohypha guttulata TaxID=1690604 RepID=UPI002DDE2A62|nr:hypothetical protein LTR51_007738 [Lithohypha guttulata]